MATFFSRMHHNHYWPISTFMFWKLSVFSWKSISWICNACCKVIFGDLTEMYLLNFYSASCFFYWWQCCSIVALGYQPTLKNSTPSFLPSSSLNLGIVQRPFLGNPPIYWFFINAPLKIWFFREPPK